jgi:hypothetical protein
VQPPRAGGATTDIGAVSGFADAAATSGMPTGVAAQGMYEVADGKSFGTQCCWDFGNATTLRRCHHGRPAGECAR